MPALERLRALFSPRDATVGVLLAVLLLAQAGCGPPGPALSEVSGTVTLDGQPLPDAFVRFIPEVKGSEQMRPLLGRTNAQGVYFLEYSSGRHGAVPGTYRVQITTGYLPDDGPKGIRIPGKRESVPDAYNVKSTLTAEVEPKKNTFDFQLQSSAGRLIQPRTD